MICRAEGARWSVYLVEDILSIKRLVPDLSDPAALRYEEDLLDSMAPAYFGEVQLLVTAFAPDFAEEAAAREAVQHKALSERFRGLLRPARQFSKTGCQIFRGPATQ